MKAQEKNRYRNWHIVHFLNSGIIELKKFPELELVGAT